MFSFSYTVIYKQTWDKLKERRRDESKNAHICTILYKYRTHVCASILVRTLTDIIHPQTLNVILTLSLN